MCKKKLAEIYGSWRFRSEVGMSPSQITSVRHFKTVEERNQYVEGGDLGSMRGRAVMLDRMPGGRNWRNLEAAVRGRNLGSVEPGRIVEVRDGWGHVTVFERHEDGKIELAEDIVRRR